MNCLEPPHEPLESPQLTSLRQEVGDLVVQTCIEFINEQPNRFILGSEYERLNALLNNPHPNRPLQLSLFSKSFRALISRGYDLIAHFDSSLHWQLVDAIDFFNDSLPGRWAYTQEADRLRYLEWSRDYALALSSTVH
jgi:hypothetical protein